MKKSIDNPPSETSITSTPALFPIVGIGASAGGLDAFKTLIKAIPVDSNIAWVLVQHQHPTYESMLTELLQKVTILPVIEIANNQLVKPNHIYVMPANKMLTIKSGKLKLSPRPARDKPESNYPINLFFSSLAETYESNAIAVVLSGTASDGTKGLKDIKDHGGITVVQSLDTATYPGMPESAIAAGVVDFILPAEQIPKKIVEIQKVITTNKAEQLAESENGFFKEILLLLHNQRGMDFTYYKQTTIRRRILRRMVLNKFKKLSDYYSFLIGDIKEVNALYQDMLIPVTSFFRDEKVFNNLCETVFPALIKNKAADGHIRIWVAGCSTGQEAYSIAMCFKEYLGHKKEKLQIFATDLSEPAIAKARTGLYTKDEIESVSPARLKKFFTVSHGQYLVNKELRDICVFAVHNFLKDPPFVKIDFISCRNVLIYMDSYLQKKALTTFHYALNRRGILMLGKSENTIGISDLFIANNKTEKLFTRKDITPAIPFSISKQHVSKDDAVKKNILPETSGTDFQKAADDIILSRYSPVSVIVNESFDIVHFRGQTSLYLEQSTGKPTHNLLKMAKTGLAFELRSLLHKAAKEKQAVRKENILVQGKGSDQLINVEAIPIPGLIEPHWLVTFSNSVTLKGNRSAAKSSRLSKKDEDTLRLHQLEQELAQLREDMRSISEEQEASNEELQSSNEELLSSNEELQSLNEELETSKEELQSTIEELTVLNMEMVNLNEQLAIEKDYAEAIIGTIPQPLLVLDSDLRVTVANPDFYRHFLVNESQTIGKLIFEIGNRQWDIPALRSLLENILPQKESFYGFEVEHTFESIGKRIMRLNAREVIRDKQYKRILLVIEDVTEQVQAARKIKESEHRYSSMIYSSPFMIAILEGKDLVIKDANDAMLATWDKGKEIFGQPLAVAIPESVERGSLDRLKKVYETGEPYYGYEIPITTTRKGKPNLSYYTFIYQAQKNINGGIEGVAILANEVTPQAIFNRQIKQSEEKFQAAVAAVNGIVWTNNAAGEMEGEQGPWAELTGQRFEEYQGYGWASVVHPDDKQSSIHAWQDAVNKKSTFVFEHRIKVRDGSWRLFSIRAIPLKNEDDSIRGWVGVHTDITEKRKAENALMESEEKFRTMAESSDILIGVNNETIDAVYFNKTWERLTGRPVEQLLKLGWADLLHPEDRDPFLKKFLAAFEKKVSYDGEYRIKNKEGGYSWLYSKVQVRLHPDGSYAGHISSSIDITQLKLNEKALKESEAKLKSLIAAAPIAIGLFIGRDLVIENPNQEFIDIVGKGPDIVGKRLTEVMPELIEQGQPYLKILDDVFTSGKMYESLGDPVNIVRNGVMHHGFYNIYYVPLFDSEGKVYGIMDIATDVTEQVLSKRKIEESEKRFRDLSDQAPMWVWLSDLDYNVLYANTELLRFLGIGNYKEFTGQVWIDKIHPEDLPLIYNTVSKAVELKEGYSLEARVINASTGEYEWFFLKCVPRSENGEFNGFIGTAINIQQQKSTLSQLEYRKALLEAHNESSVDGILLVDAKGKILTYNKRFIEIWNMPPEITEAKDDEAALSFAISQLENPSQFIEKVKFLYEHPDKTSIDELLFKDGKIILRNGYPVIADDGSYYAWSWIFRDITEQRNAENKIKESEEYFHRLTDTVPAIIWITEADGYCSYLNKRWYEYTGQNENEGEGYGWLTATHPDDAERASQAFLEANIAQKPFICLYRLRVKDGTYRWAKDIGSPRFNAEGKYEGMIGTVVDVHEETIVTRQIKESEKRFRLLADTLPQLVWTADVEGNLNYYNQSMLDYSGLSIEQINIDGWKQLVHPDDWQDNIQQWNESIQQGTDFISEHRFKKYDNEYRWQLSRAVPQRDANGNITLWVGSSTDIQKMKEEEKRKADFIKMVSHELKTPITSIKGYVQYLLTFLRPEQKTDLTTIPFKTSLERIDNQILRLTRLITEMLDLSRLEDSRLMLSNETFSIRKLVEETVQDIKHTSNSHVISLYAHYDGEVNGDRDRIQQVLINLINNAIKYSPVNMPIDIMIEQAEDNHIAISVKDMGIGINKAEQEKIFERFYRVSGRNEATYSGFGIGLFIVSQIIERHNGKIMVESEVGKGSLFTFLLPLAREKFQSIQS